MPEDKKTVAETALTTIGEELEVKRRRLELERVKAERKKAIRLRRDETIKHKLSGVLLDAARKVELRQHAFKSDEELAALKLKPNEIALVRQWEEAKRNAAYALESSSKQIEAHLRGQAEKQVTKLNIGNVEQVVLRLPEKEDETAKPVVIEITPESK